MLLFHSFIANIFSNAAKESESFNINSAEDATNTNETTPSESCDINDSIRTDGEDAASLPVLSSYDAATRNSMSTDGDPSPTVADAYTKPFKESDLEAMNTFGAVSPSSFVCLLVCFLVDLHISLFQSICLSIIVSLNY